MSETVMSHAVWSEVLMSETAPMEVLLPEGDVLVDEDRPWAVIVWNDPINLMNYVSFVFRKLFGFGQAKADKLMRDVHEKGRANVATGSRSECERHVHQLHSHGLWATMEHDE